MLTKLYVNTEIFLREKATNFKNDSSGVTAIEYAILGVAVSALILVVFKGALKGALDHAISNISANITSANTAQT